MIGQVRQTANNSEPKFVVLTAQRSGSTWFIDTLNNLPATTAYTELLLPRRKPRNKRLMSSGTAKYLDDNLRPYPLFIEADNTGLSFRPLSLFNYLNELFRKPGAVGFKLMYANILLYPEVWPYIVLRHLPVVHLVRRNHFDVFISEQMGQATKTLHRIVGDPEVAEVQIEINTRDLVKQMKRSQRNINIARRLLRIFNVAHIELAYEDLVEDPKTFDIVFEWLSINREQRVPYSKLERLRKRKYSEIISNYSEVRNVLATTEFASLLD